MATKAQIDAQIAKLRKARESADDDDIVDVRDESGRVIRLTGGAARRMLDKLGLSDEPADDEDDEGDDEDDDEPATKSRKRAPKRDAEPPRRDFPGRFFGRE